MKSNQDQVQDTPVLAGNDDWHKLTDSMALDGLTKELASHCTLQGYAGNRISLKLHPAQEHLSATNQEEKLQAALRSRLGAEIRLVVSDRGVPG